MSRRSYRDQSREQLLRFWERDDGDGAAIGCVTTTYTFDAAFFEEECLARFVGLEGNPREDLRSYVVEREEKLSQVFAVVLVDQAHVAKQRSLRWNLLPVRVAGGGVMHAKVTVLLWEHRIRVLIGSANLTEAAYRTNYEHVGALDFTAESEVPLSLLTETIDFLDRLRGLAPGMAEEQDTGPQVALERFLLELRRRVSEWESAPWRRGAPSAVLVPVWPGESSLFEQLAPLFPARTGPQNVWILSPFFDEGDGSREVVEALVAIMAHREERGLYFTAAGRVLPDSRTVELELPECLSTPWLRRVGHEFELVLSEDPLDDGEVTRWLHAKSLWLRRGDRVLYSIGSSNFTRAGTGLLGARSNVELNLAYVIPDLGSSFGGRCEAAEPPVRRLGEEDELHFLPPDDRTLEAEASTPLPACFGLALFRPEAEFGELLLQISEPSPRGFRVESENGEVILAAETWATAGHPSSLQVSWPYEAPPSHLIVRWVEPAGACEAVWVVNVTDGSRLPPPEELRGLDLEELISILTSARPLHEAIGHVVGKRSSAPRPADPIMDSHAKVDTRNFLIRRMRRVAAGLEGLRARLERPAHHRDALRWRLHGPVGPVALARRLHKEEQGAGAFMLAEVALTVDRCDWSSAEASLGLEVVRAEVGAVLEKLAELASESDAPPNLETYVTEAFAEVRG